MPDRGGEASTGEASHSVRDVFGGHMTGSGTEGDAVRRLIELRDACAQEIAAAAA